VIKYVVAQNPDTRVLKMASRILSNGGLVALPTDTNWVVTADPNSKSGVEKLYRLKKAQPEKHFSMLCDSISRAAGLALIDDAAFRMLRGKIPGHFTFIFRAQKPVVKMLKASKRDQEIGIRFPPSRLAQNLIAEHGGPLLSSRIKHEMLGLDPGEVELYGYLIADAAGGLIDLVLDPGEVEFVGESTIVTLFNDTEPVVRRQGAGRWE